MVISVNFSGLHRKLIRKDQIQIPLSKGTRVSDLLVYMRACYPELPLNENVLMVTVNNQVSKLDRILESDDKISFIPHIGGG